MKTLSLFLVVLVALVAALPQQQEHQVGSKIFLERQKDILKLFKFINQPSYYTQYVEIAQNFPVQNEEYYTKPEVVKSFFYLYSKGLLPRGEIFSIYFETHLVQAKALYKLFYYAKDFDTFLKVAIWARQNVNEGMFVYILSVTLAQRQDTQNFVLPPIYEIYPQYFFSSEVIQQAQIYKQQLMSPVPSRQAFIINANYSGYYLNLNKEQSMSYFTEDVGYNAFYYYYNIYYPFWLDASESQQQIRRPLIYSMAYPQILAKYYLERLSNGLGEIPYLEFENPVLTGFYSSLRYPNGLEFPVRPDSLQYMSPLFVPTSPYNYNYTEALSILQDYARRIRDAIDLGYVENRTGEKIMLSGAKGLEILTNIIQGNPNSPNYRYYGSLPRYAKRAFGYSFVPQDSYKILPSALELTETALRDPMFYQIYQTIFLNIHRYLSYESPYTYQDLVLPGVKIQDVEMDRLITYFDYFYIDITNALYVTPQEFNEDNLLVQVRQQRLNHKPFNYKINVQSAQSQDVLVKIFIGPKYDQLDNVVDLYENRWNFVLIDSFDYKLQVGQNIIERSSKQSMYYLPDKTSYRDIYNKVMMAVRQKGEFEFGSEYVNFAFPSRLMLPKGTPSGQMYQLYVFVGPTDPQAFMPMLYPFDQFAEESAYRVPNAFFKDIMIYLKDYSEMNKTI